jgi:hypothetical protein
MQVKLRFSREEMKIFTDTFIFCLSTILLFSGPSLSLSLSLSLDIIIIIENIQEMAWFPNTFLSTHNAGNSINAFSYDYSATTKARNFVLNDIY